MKAPAYVRFWDEMNEVPLEEQLKEKAYKERISGKVPTINIICHRCRDRVGFIKTDEVDIPLTGSMFHPHPGCESWAMPPKNGGVLEFTCPHAAFEGGDQHLFLPIDKDNPQNSSRMLTEDFVFFEVEMVTTECPCGCGGKVRGSRKFADGLMCYNRMKARGERG